MKNLTRGWKQLGHFFQKQGTFFKFSEKGRGELNTSPTLVVPLPLEICMGEV